MSAAGEVLRKVERLRAHVERLGAAAERDRAVLQRLVQQAETRLEDRRRLRAELNLAARALSKALNTMPGMIAAQAAAAARENAGCDHAG